MFARIVAWLRGVMTKMLFPGGLPTMTGGVPLAISDKMTSAIERWRDEYAGNAYWLKHGDQSLSLPALIASEIANLVTLEAKITISGSPRADWLMEQFKPVLENLRINVEYACALGGIVMKPYFDGSGISVDYIQADDFFPVAFDSKGNITSAIFIERKRVGQAVYSRVEHHTIEPKLYTITNRCYRGYSDDDVGTEVPLDEIPEWKNMQPKITMANIPFPLFAYFKIPLGNNVDPKSPLGVSVFAKAEANIKEADFQYQRLLWEYKGGELAIDASEDAFELDRNGKAIIPIGKERLYRVNQFSVKKGVQNATFSTFSPTLRDESYRSGLNSILQKIEDQCGLARGTLSEQPDTNVQTATEIRILRQRTYATITGIQTSLEKALQALINAMDATATLYHVVPAGPFVMTCIWDDSVVTDADTERVRDMQEVRDSIMKKWEYRVKWYGETEEQAKAMVGEEDEQTDDEIMNFVKKESGSDAGSDNENNETGGNENG